MNEPGPMPTGGSQNRAPPSPLPGLRRRPGWSPYTGLQDPVATGAARSSSDPTTTAAWYVTNGAQRGAGRRASKVGPQGSESVMVTRRFNTFLEEMQNRWAREREEGPYRTPVEPAKKGSVGLSDPLLGGSVSQSLIQLRAQMQQLSTVVANRQARADIQTAGRAVRHPVVSTPLAPRFPADDDGISDAWVGLSHKEAVVSPSPAVLNRPVTRYSPSLARAETLTTRNVGQTTPSTLVKEDPHGLDASEREARFPARRRSPELAYGQGRRDVWDGPMDPSGWCGTTTGASVVDRDNYSPWTNRDGIRGPAPWTSGNGSHGTCGQTPNFYDSVKRSPARVGWIDSPSPEGE